MAVAASLFRLEQLDAEIQQTEAELAATRRRQGRNSELEATERRLDDLRNQERAATTEQHSLESDLADVETKMKRDQARMYCGQIVDPRELASLERELEHLRAQRDAVEERCLVAMERLEELQQAVATVSRQANEMRDRWEANRPELARQEEGLVDALAALRDQRSSLAASIDPQALNLYGRLQASAGHAVSVVSNGVCQWCRVVIPPKDVQHARAGSLVTCTNCARILYTGAT